LFIISGGRTLARDWTDAMVITRTRRHAAGVTLDYWTPQFEENSSLTVAYGKDDCIDYEGSIEDAILEGSKLKGTYVSHLAHMRALQ
jgi:hypothetical protein